VLRVARNWARDDKDFAPREYYVHYQYMPGFGFYGWGFFPTAGRRRRRADDDAAAGDQHRDAAVFPGGVRVKGMRVEKSNVMAGPGEFVEVDTGGMPIQPGDHAVSLPRPVADAHAGHGGNPRERPAPRLHRRHGRRRGPRGRAARHRHRHDREGGEAGGRRDQAAAHGAAQGAAHARRPVRGRRDRDLPLHRGRQARPGHRRGLCRQRGHRAGFGPQHPDPDTATRPGAGRDELANQSGGLDRPQARRPRTSCARWARPSRT
jgi:hypothetical protein